MVSYGTGILSLHPLAENGEIGPLSQQIKHSGSSVNLERQDSAHPHSIYVDPSNQFVIVPDLGMDKVMVYRLDRAGCKLDLHDEVAVEQGAGPRHLAFHPKLPYAYLIEELSSRITVYDYDVSSGKLQAVQSVNTLPDDFTGANLCAEVQVSPDGCFVYGSNRGHDSIAVFAVDAATGKLTLVERASTLGKHPRNFCLTPDGRHLFVANKDSNSLHVLNVDKETGKLHSTGLSIEVAQPTCVRFFLLD
jgi:6-phosphogluconolactonase